MLLKKICVRQIALITTLLQFVNEKNILHGLYNCFKSRKDEYVTVFKEYMEAETDEIQYRGYNYVGIVLQGPIRRDDNFTLNTVRLFRKRYPEVQLVFSTWKDSLSNYEKQTLKKYNCHIIESQSMSPEYKGDNEKVAHLNNQILSSRNGIDYLSRNNVSHVMKIRSDLRIYKVDFIPYLLNVLTSFKCTKYRLINIAFSNSLYNVPFHLSDFIWFGEINDMKKLYDIPYRDINKLQSIVEKVNKGLMDEYRDDFKLLRRNNYSLNTSWYKKTKIDESFLTLYHEEVYLPFNFWVKSNHNQQGNLLDSYYMFLKSIIVLDDTDLLVYWDKYLYSIIKTNYSMKQEGRLSHSKWLDLFLNYRG